MADFRRQLYIHCDVNFCFQPWGNAKCLISHKFSSENKKWPTGKQKSHQMTNLNKIKYVASMFLMYKYLKSQVSVCVPVILLLCPTAALSGHSAHSAQSHSCLLTAAGNTHTLLKNFYLYKLTWTKKYWSLIFFSIPQHLVCVDCSQVDVSPASEEEQTSRSCLVPPLNHWSWWDFHTFCDVLWS